ncbi:hypothetical protein BSKO_02096 [Bryopsis sp. KO-2023]|nr:hypothetical protein BSKO_02096 [Bryopsis sp. KO-2023]
MTQANGRSVTFAPSFPVKADRVGTLVPPERQGPKKTPPKLPVHDPLRYNFIPSRRGIVMREVKEMVVVFAEPEDWETYRPTLFKLLKRAVFNEICHIEGFDPDVSHHARGLAEDITRIMLMGGTPEFVVAGAISVQRVVWQCHDRIDEGIYLGGDIFRGIDELADDLLRIKGRFCGKEDIIQGSPRQSPPPQEEGEESICTIYTRTNELVCQNEANSRRGSSTNEHCTTATATTECASLDDNPDVNPTSARIVEAIERGTSVKEDCTGEGSRQLPSSIPSPGAPACQRSWGRRNFETVMGGQLPSHPGSPPLLPCPSQHGFNFPAITAIGPAVPPPVGGETTDENTLASNILRHGGGSVIQMPPELGTGIVVPNGRCGSSGQIAPVQYLYGLVPVQGYVCHPGQLPTAIIAGWRWAPLRPV